MKAFIFCGGRTNISDGRFKTEVKEDVAGMDFILKLRPVTYHLDKDAVAKHNNTPDSLRLFESEQKKAEELGPLQNSLHHYNRG